MKHFLHISDYTDTELWEILKLAKDLKSKFHNLARLHISYKPIVRWHLIIQGSHHCLDND